MILWNIADYRLIVVYIGFIYIRECKRYHIKLSSNIFYKILILSTFSIIFDGTTAVTVNYLDHVNPILNKALHLIFLIGIDTVIYMMSGYMLRMTEVIPVNRRGSIFLKDFAVIPSYQGKGVGKCLMEALERYVKECKPLEWAVSLELISTIEAVDFYKKFGFEERPCEWDGPGMFKMVR